jgi:MFS family permease
MAAFNYRDFRLFEVARFFSTLGVQMQSVAVGWQVYEMTQRPIDLGYVGLAQFAPLLGFSLISGHVADRYDRRSILLVYHAILVVCALLLTLFTLTGAGVQLGVWPIFILLLVLGSARAFAGPAASALMPSLVATQDFPNALAWNSSIWQVATVVGPALGGVIYGFQGGGSLVYAVFGLSSLVSFAAIWGISIKTGRLHHGAATWERLVAGVAYVRAHKVLLGAISLDLFAVLLGGATALLPVFARDILAVGPSGLGVLRSAPALGAVIMAVFLAFRPLTRHSGPVMLACVALFGIATCVFARSTNFILSIGALVVMGASDVVSVFVRQTLIQLKTPSEMRGRVSAVSQVFISASNELGEFESGITAAWFGAAPAAFIGGLGTLLVVGLWSLFFPDLRNADRLLPDQEEAT